VGYGRIVVLAAAAFAQAAAAPASAGSTARVSVSSSGGQGNRGSAYPVLSADGRFVAFDSRASNLVPGDTNGTTDVFAHDRRTGATRRVSVSSGGRRGNGESFGPALSADGRLVAFHSSASDLVPGDINDAYDVFVHISPPCPAE